MGAEELTMEETEFKGHRFALSKLPVGSTPQDVAAYLRNNNLLLTAAQAAEVFDILVAKLRVDERMPHGLRGQLIHALHSFCLEPYAIWEPNDGNSECLWANMTWANTSLAYDARYKIRGELVNLPNTTAPSKPQLDVLGL